MWNWALEQRDSRSCHRRLSSLQVDTVVSDWVESVHNRTIGKHVAKKGARKTSKILEENKSSLTKDGIPEEQKGKRGGQGPLSNKEAG